MAAENITRDNIEAGSGAFQARTEIVASGQNLKRGDVVKLDANGKLAKIATGDTPHGVMFEDVDATGGDKAGAIYYSGYALVEDELDYGDGNADEFREALRERGIILVKGVK